VIDVQLLENVSNILRTKHLSIAIAESCTGGLLANIITNIPNSSEYFKMGIISYSNQSKINFLKVSKKALVEFGAVSELVAKEMAIGIKKIVGVDIGVSITGIAGPSGGTKLKPVGLVFIGVAIKGEIIVKKFTFTGNRMQIKEDSCNAALKMLLEII
jgi:PncC family amidohydrolase